MSKTELWIGKRVLGNLRECKIVVQRDDGIYEERVFWDSENAAKSRALSAQKGLGGNHGR